MSTGLMVLAAAAAAGGVGLAVLLIVDAVRGHVLDDRDDPELTAWFAQIQGASTRVPGCVCTVPPSTPDAAAITSMRCPVPGHALIRDDTEETT